MRFASDSLQMTARPAGAGRNSLDRLAFNQLEQISINPGIDPGARRRCHRMSRVLSSYEGGAIAPRRSRFHAAYR
jgi:hypothetical protein